jgi:hypothetical protein
MSLVTCVHMNNVEQRERKVKAIAADPLCVPLLERVLEFRRSEPPLRFTWPSFGNTTVYMTCTNSDNFPRKLARYAPRH